MEAYESAWKGIVQPPQIKNKKRMLGPTERTIDGCNIRRVDLQPVNANKKKLSGFLFYAPQQSFPETILYLHGNGGSKNEAISFVQYIQKYKVNILAFDFLGCGNSDPDNLTYGINEVFDIEKIIDEARKIIPIKRVTIWGRSMGAMCAVMFAEMYPYEVRALVLDSPFCTLSKVVEKIAIHETSLPLFILKPVLYLVKKKAEKEAQHEIFSINYLTFMKKLSPKLPILFIFSHNDEIVPSEDVFNLFNAHQGPKDLYQIYETHDEDRKEELFKQGLFWLRRKTKYVEEKNKKIYQ